MNDRLLKKLILKEIHSVLNEGGAPENLRRKAEQLINDAHNMISKAYNILSTNDIGTSDFSDKILELKTQLDDLVLSDLGERSGRGDDDEGGEGSMFPRHKATPRKKSMQTYEPEDLYDDANEEF